MMRFTKGYGETAIVMSATLIVCTVAWLLAITHGPLATMFLKGSVGNVVGDACFYLSLPGWLLAVVIRGYDSGATVLSQCFAVGANVVLYGLFVMLLLKAARFIRTREKST